MQKMQKMQKFVHQTLAMTLVMALVAPVAGHAAAKFLYRYVNAEGLPETSHTIPTDRVPLGYEVIDARSGRLVRIVERQKTQAEVDRINRETTARNACQTALDRVNSLYQSEIDIAAAEKQAVEALEVRIANALSNERLALDQQRDYEATAAQLERSGKSLDANLVNNIRRAEIQVSNMRREIKQRRGEQTDAHVRFAQDLALFEQATCADEAALGFVQTEVVTSKGGD